MVKVNGPGKIICVGRNYIAHARELGKDGPAEPLIFLKPRSSVIADGEPIVIPELSAQVESEGEIGIVFGRRLRRSSEQDAERSIRAIIAVNDVTARDLQRTDGQWTRAATGTPAGLCPILAGEVADVEIIGFSPLRNPDRGEE